jgi:hypothetical protein
LKITAEAVPLLNPVGLGRDAVSAFSPAARC